MSEDELTIRDWRQAGEALIVADYKMFQRLADLAQTVCGPDVNGVVWNEIGRYLHRFDPAQFRAVHSIAVGCVQEIEAVEEYVPAPAEYVETEERGFDIGFCLIDGGIRFFVRWS